jgi:integrase
MGWLPWPILPRKRWPAPQFKEKRAITWEEHQRVVLREPNPQTRAFYQMSWHLGGAQSDVARLRAADIDWEAKVISYFRVKTGTISLLQFGPEVEELLRSLPKEGFLFPRLALMDEKHRAKEFRRRCLGLGIRGVSLHSYRYAWAERAKAAGYPERFAQEALGHNSKAVHRAYARKAQVQLPSLSEYERRRALFTAGGKADQEEVKTSRVENV